jgi:hypothetical protein
MYCDPNCECCSNNNNKNNTEPQTEPQVLAESQVAIIFAGYVAVFIMEANRQQAGRMQLVTYVLCLTNAYNYIYLHACSIARNMCARI